MSQIEPDPSPDRLIGHDIEGFRLTRQVGRGGMGRIYEAIHPAIGQRAAVKLLAPELTSDEDARSRFLDEARAAGQIRHPGIVRVFHHGLLADGTAYIIMEFLPGESLEARLRRLAADGARLPAAEALRIACQIASALAAAHRAGIVHRDLKPANVLTFADPETEGGERIKIVDFGIAKFTGGGATDVARTTIGKFLGTARYASPEQCQMAGQVGAQADVYALGVILYEMLSGAPPFAGDTPGAVMAMHLNQPPRPLHKAAPGAPEALGLLVHQMLAKDPAQRPTMEALVARLQQMRLTAPRRRWIGPSGVAAALLLAALAWEALRIQLPAPPQLDMARSAPPDAAQSAPPDAAQPAPPPDAAERPRRSGLDREHKSPRLPRSASRPDLAAPAQELPFEPLPRVPEP